MEKYFAICQECDVDRDLKPELCYVCLTQRLLNGKWKLVIIYLLKDKTLRFSEIKRSIPKVTQAYLSSQLKELVEDEIIIRHSYHEVPPRVEYYLSEEGRKIIDVIDSMENWGADYISKRMNS
jgi:DNA-binding HxlR family transcriptional regulator